MHNPQCQQCSCLCDSVELSKAELIEWRIRQQHRCRTVWTRRMLALPRWRSRERRTAKTKNGDAIWYKDWSDSHISFRIPTFPYRIPTPLIGFPHFPAFPHFTKLHRTNLRNFYDFTQDMLKIIVFLVLKLKFRPFGVKGTILVGLNKLNFVI